MSVWVITSPLMIAVALTTDGMAVPNSCGFCGRLSVAVELTGSAASTGTALWAATPAAVAASARPSEIDTFLTARALAMFFIPTTKSFIANAVMNWPLPSWPERQLSGQAP